MKKILFSTDFSEVADNAFVYTLHLAKSMQAEIIVVHAFDAAKIGRASCRERV